MNSIIDGLWEFVSNPTSLYYNVHSSDISNELDPGGDLRCFLFATMDEVRLRSASRYLTQILRQTDLEDAEHFRQGLLRREVTGRIAYPKQRDHSAHTLYNYLLGWYFFANSDKIQSAMSDHCKRRGEADGLACFRDLWPIASVLHDIGYLFEGAIDPLSMEIQSAQANLGAEVCQEYFRHRFWMESSADSAHARQRLIEMSGIEMPDFSSKSLSGIADALRSLGNLETLTAAVRREVGESNGRSRLLAVAGGLPGDAFDVWESHFEFFGFDTMRRRIQELRTVHRALIQSGLGNTGLRILDHGISGGLLLLLYSTFYFKLRFGLASHIPNNPSDEAICNRFRSASPEDEATYTAKWWWQGVVWATAATALHNVQQQGSWPSPAAHSGPLGLEEDSLTYLGILVDCIQEWDRYTVSRESVIGGNLPLQGVDVKFDLADSKIKISLRNPDRIAAVRKTLDTALRDWQDVVEIN